MQEVERKEESSEIVALVGQEEDDDDGPPPGFGGAISPQKDVAETIPEAEIDVVVDDDDGPPPGFGSISPNPPPTIVSSEINCKQEEAEEDDDGPPPGWEFSNLSNALPKLQSNVTDTKMDSNGELEEEDEDGGPPPGWENVLLPHKQTPPSTTPSSTVSSNGEMETKEKVVRSNDEVSPPVSETTPVPEKSATPPPQSPPPPQKLGPCDTLNKEEAKDNNKDHEMEKSSHILKQASPQKPPSKARDSASSEKAQLVCGTCRKLCLYPRGAKWVQCPECKEVNFVLEGHEIGNVKCGGCATLLMYPHGAPAVQCTSCHFVTEIGAHNEKPPLSARNPLRRRVRVRRPNRAR